ncbi:uncharacterized protein EDC62_2538 [Tibeticola sediminis]|uniref:Zinc chelation protein SecC n=1 Tax=Tibeticola sediminis TaxID=1917811 RepID=A0A3N4U7B9_9BURK|nr:UPF0149 family protein [Tibeticola sediminis]RPE62839.1 uncharacterized protein EDC62_2538 [Tibeticola sediminis]
MTADTTTPAPQGAEMQPEDYETLETILDELRTRNEDTPQWEFCEGFIAALACARTPVPTAEALRVLFGGGADGALAEGTFGVFADAAQAARFVELWERRLAQVKAALQAEVENLDDTQAYAPELLDMRGMVALLSEDDRRAFEQEVGGAELPSFAQVWAIGFLTAVESWPEDWALPRDREAADLIDDSLDAIHALTEDDRDPPTLSPFSEDGPPSISESRLDAYADAIWAVYDLHDVWASLGPRVETVRRALKPGRNDPCPCGSGKKYKKCCGQ